MGYYMRFIVADERAITLSDVHTALSKVSSDYEVDGEGMDATVSLRGHRVGHLTLNVPGATFGAHCAASSAHIGCPHQRLSHPSKTQAVAVIVPIFTH